MIASKGEGARGLVRRASGWTCSHELAKQANHVHWRESDEMKNHSHRSGLCETGSDEPWTCKQKAWSHVPRCVEDVRSE
eukprot:6209027-Pleurochrysis_carterae.AAC.4